MPPKRGTKRQNASPESDGKPSKKSKNPLEEPHPSHQVAEKNGIVLRKYYPREMSNERARAYTNDEIERPFEALQKAQDETFEKRKGVKMGDAVVHWFKMDLRTADNRSLRFASEKAKDAGVPLIALYVVSPQDFEAHLTSPARVDFMLRSLAVVREDLAKLDIPLYVETVDKRKAIPGRIAELMSEWGASHLLCNMEYEVDELRREASMVRMLAEQGKSFEVFQDTCVVAPGELQTGAGKQYAVYTPWYRAWMRHIHENPDLLELHGPPEKNPGDARKRFAKLFDAAIPEEVKGKELDDDQKKRYRSFFPAGEHEAKDRLDKFCEENIGSYSDLRNIPADNGTSLMSVHLSSGTISSRTCVRTARNRNKTKKLDGGIEGIKGWISEVAWRDFYKHVLAHWPYVW